MVTPVTVLAQATLPAGSSFARKKLVEFRLVSPMPPKVALLQYDTGYVGVACGVGRDEVP